MIKINGFWLRRAEEKIISENCAVNDNFSIKIDDYGFDGVWTVINIFSMSSINWSSETFISDCESFLIENKSRCTKESNAERNQNPLKTGSSKHNSQLEINKLETDFRATKC